MAKIRFENGTVVNFNGNPTTQDVEEVASRLGLKKASKSPFNPNSANSQFTQPTPAGATQMQYKPEDNTGLGKNFAKAVPKALATVAVGSPVKLAVSGAEGLATTIKTGGQENASGKTYNIPGLEPFKSFQSQAVDRARAGQNPFLNVLQGGAETALAGLDTVGVGKAAGKVPKLLAKVDVRAGGAAAESAIKNVLTQNAKTVETTAGKIIQGGVDDIKPAQQVLTKVNPNKVKTYKDLETQLANNEKTLVEAKGKALSTNTTNYTAPDMTVKVGNVNHNFVDDALNQLEKHYTQTSEIAKKAEIQALKTKAATKGLTIKEIDDLAVRHGQDLNAYNKSGDLAAALSKQQFENTRAGLKTTARQLFGDEAYKAVDAELSSVITTRKLVSDMVEKVNELQQKIQQRGLGERIGRALGQGINFFSGGTAKGLVESFLSRGTGLKTLNALDLEAQLQKNLKLLQEASRPGASEATIISKLKEIVDNPPISKGNTTIQTIEPQKLEYFKPNPNKAVRVNDYQNPGYPRYIPAEQINKGMERLRQATNKGKSIDSAGR